MKYTLSIVSHESGPLVTELLKDLRRHLVPEIEIILTFNVPEDESFLANFGDLPIRVIRNKREPLGFGANHNRAFAASAGQWFVVVNPDVRLPNCPLSALASVCAIDDVGACAPLVMSPAGIMEDSLRRFPTITKLLRRVLLKQRRADYTPDTREAQAVDWAAGMFVMFRRQAFAAVNGFDTRYFMYFEDADICRRLWANGWSVQFVPQAQVIHAAQRASHRSRQHLKWHLRSAIRFLLRF